MLHSLKLKDKDFKFGVTRVFFRPGKFSEFDTIMKSDPENLKSIIADVKKFLIKSRWIKTIFCAITVIKRALSVFVIIVSVLIILFICIVKNKINYRRQALIVIQKSVKGYITRKRHGPRIKTLLKIKGIDGNLKKIENVAQQLKKDKESSTNEINKLKDEIASAIAKIKVDISSKNRSTF